MHGLATRIIIASSFASLLLTASVAYAATYDVTNYGATGNSVTDDRVAIQNAINAVASTSKKCDSGQVLYFPRTSTFYKTSHFLKLSNSVYSTDDKRLRPYTATGRL